MTTFLLLIQRPLAALLPLFASCFLLASSPLLGQCDLPGPYTNLSGIQGAINTAANAPNNCTTITLAGTAQWTGNLDIPASASFVIGNTATMNGNGSITSTNDIAIDAGGTFNTNGNDITINGTTFSGQGTLTGPIPSLLARLPVEFISFTARQQAAGLALSWETATELNNFGFEVQRSQDGRSFSSLAMVAGAGTTQEKQSYSYLDRSSLAGTHYYRLKQIDYDGTYAYSDVVTAQMSRSEEPAFFPNPVAAGGIITLVLSQDALPQDLTLRDALGSVIATEYTAQGNVLQVQLPSGIAKGFYFMSVNASGESYTKAISVQ